MREEKSTFHYRILPIDPDFPDTPRRPSPEIQQEALTDVLCQLVTYLTAAAKNSRTDPFQAFRVLANCEKILDGYASANFTLLADFQHLLKTNLRAALRPSPQGVLPRSLPVSQHGGIFNIQAGHAGRWMAHSHSEAMEDYRQVVSEMFDGDRLRPSALAERQRRSQA